MMILGNDIVNPLQRGSVTDNLQASPLSAVIRTVLCCRLPGRKIRRDKVCLLLSLLLALCWYRPLHAVIEIEVTKGGFNAIPIAIVPFGWSGSAPIDLSRIIGDDLVRSGLFTVMSRDQMPEQPVSGDRPNYNAWRAAGADYLVIGGGKIDGAKISTVFQLFDPIRQKLLTGFSYTVPEKSLRGVGHQMADVIFEEITGLRGAFNTEIAYVNVSGSLRNRSYQLQLADADGQNPQAMLTSPRPILSPSWSPDAKQIAYVSFEDRERSAVYVQDRVSGKRTKIISRQGINGAPSWSPDGTRLAVVLSYEGNPDIYVVDIGTKQGRRVTNDTSIDTEPEWLDNETLVFTSDRSGGPQIYRISSNGGRAERLTFEGNYNASASVAPDGRGIAVVHGVAGAYRIGLLEFSTGDFRVLTTGRLDESPSFAPNSQMILFATNRDAQEALGAVSVDGEVEQSFVLGDSNVREPSWSPFTN